MDTEEGLVLSLGLNDLSPNHEEALKDLLLLAWSGGWSPVEWGLAVQQTHSGTHAHSRLLADLLLQQAIVGPKPSVLLISYMEHALATCLLVPADFFDALLLVLQPSPSPRLAALLPLISTFVLQLARPPLDAGAQWPSKVISACTRVFAGMLRLATGSLALVEKEAGQEGNDECVVNAEACVRMCCCMLENTQLAVLLCLAKDHDPELWRETEGLLLHLGGNHQSSTGSKRPHHTGLDLTALIRLVYRMFGFSMIGGESSMDMATNQHAFPFSHRPIGYDYINNELACHSVYRGLDSTSTNEGGVGGWRPIESYGLTVSFWMHYQSTHLSFDSLEHMVQHWYGVGLTEKLPYWALYYHMIRSILDAMAEDPSTEQDKWCNMLLLRVPLVLQGLEVKRRQDPLLVQSDRQPVWVCLQRLASNSGSWLAAQASNPNAYSPSLLAVFVQALLSNQLIDSAQAESLLSPADVQSVQASNASSLEEVERALAAGSDNQLDLALACIRRLVIHHYSLCQLILDAEGVRGLWENSATLSLILPSLAAPWLYESFFACGLAGQLRLQLLKLLDPSHACDQTNNDSKYDVRNAAYLLLCVLQGIVGPQQDGQDGAQGPVWLGTGHVSVDGSRMDEALEVLGLLRNCQDMRKWSRQALDSLVKIAPTVAKLCLKQQQAGLDYPTTLQPLQTLLSVSSAAFFAALLWLSQETKVASQLSNCQVGVWNLQPWSNGTYTSPIDLPLPQVVLLDLLMHAQGSEHWSMLVVALPFHVWPTLLANADPGAPWMQLVPSSAVAINQVEAVSPTEFCDILRDAIIEQHLCSKPAAQLVNCVLHSPVSLTASLLVSEMAGWDYVLECGLLASLGASLLSLQPTGSHVLMADAVPRALGTLTNNVHREALAGMVARLIALSSTPSGLHDLYRSCGAILNDTPMGGEAVYALTCLQEAACLYPLVRSTVDKDIMATLWTALRRAEREDLLLSLCNITNEQERVLLA
eukprot:Ihof_evm5s381 gene=Ihof_evmTU5s381